jgi:hypothetical protein
MGTVLFSHDGVLIKAISLGEPGGIPPDEISANLDIAG